MAAAIALQLLVALPVVAARGSDDSRPSSPGSGTNAAPARDADRTAAVEALLKRRADAVLHRNKGAFLADLDPTQSRFLLKQAAQFEHLRSVRFSGWSYAVDASSEQEHTPALDAARGTWWAPDIELHYSLAGFDTSPTEEDQGFTFTQRDGRWYIAADADFLKTGRPTQRDLWDTGDVQVTKGTSCLALAHPGGAGMAALALHECDLSVPRVTAVWGTGWSRKVVLVIPDTPAELQTLVPDIGDVSNIAAVATAALVDQQHGYHPVGDRVVVNPDNFRDLGPIGRRVVLTHEVTHVASRAATGPEIPTWFVEGIADYVGFLHTDIPLSLSALELRKAIRAGHVPTHLPDDAVFKGGRADLAASYEQSWLAVRLMVRTYGQARMLELYRDIGDGTSSGAIDVAFAKDLHTSVDAFTRASIADLKRQLS
ncbi:MAG: hypothetical protein JWO22_516 [Frankiales bacterium]|nr:hypothetical protein [Frankiales bacterium]